VFEKQPKNVDLRISIEIGTGWGDVGWPKKNCWGFLI